MSKYIDREELIRDIISDMALFRQTVLRFSAGDGCCNNGRTKVIPHIILDNKDRADAALLGADHRVQVCIEQIATPDSLSHKLTS